MNRYTRIHHTPPGDKPQADASRLHGNTVSVGEPVVLHGDTDMRKQVESSLEILAKQRLGEVEDQARELLARANAQARELLEHANAQARELLETAQAQENAIREAAHEEGFRAGFQEGYTDATEQVEQETIELLQGAHTLVDGAYIAEKRVLADFEKHALQLMRHIIQRILQRELSDAPETLAHMLTHAVESLYLSGKVKVVVNPQVLQDLRTFTEKTSEVVDGLSRFEFIADPDLDPQQIFIVGQEGSFDISPATQAEQMLAAIEPDFALPREVEATAEEPASSPAMTASPPPDAPSHCEEAQSADLAISPIEGAEEIATSPALRASSTNGPRNDKGLAHNDGMLVDDENIPDDEDGEPAV